MIDDPMLDSSIRTLTTFISELIFIIDLFSDSDL